MSGELQPQPPATTTVRWSGYADVYYGRDFGAPPTSERSFAGGARFGTHASRLDAPAVNLALLEARFSNRRAHGRFALQAGTAVRSRHAWERPGEAGRREIFRHLHEAVLGVPIREDLAVDIGVFRTHAGMESWMPADNLTYTRSLVNEYAPHQHAGARLIWSPRRWIDAAFNVVNGWRHFSEGRPINGAGVRLDLKPAGWFGLSGYNLISREDGDRLRALHGFGARLGKRPFYAIVQADLGMQERSAANGRPAHWYGYTIVGYVAPTAWAALSARFERFDDDEQIVLATGASGGTPNAPFRGYGESVGIDLRLHRSLLWRTEVRAFQNSGRSFPDRGSPVAKADNLGAVTSIAFSFRD